MVHVDSLDRLRKVCGIGSLIALVLVVFSALMAVVYAMEIAFALVDSGFFIDPMDNRGTAISGVSNLAGMLCCLWATIYGYGIINSIRSGDSPFTPCNVECMKGIASMLLIGFVAVVLIQALLILVLRPGMYLFDTPGHLLVAGAVAYLIYLIFEYGSALQTESDEFL